MHIKQCFVRSFSSAALARKVREVPDLPRHAYLAPARRKKPVYMKECSGTPRREHPVNVIDGVRYEATFNPYQTMTPERKLRLDMWQSRDWDNWNPYECVYGMGGRPYRLPDDIKPRINEAGYHIGPVLRRKGLADVKKQYTMNGLPWVWDKEFYVRTAHPKEAEPIIGRRRYSRPEKYVENQRAAIRNMDEMKLQYLKELKEKRPYNWWERVIQQMGGESALHQYARVRKIPRLL